MERAAASDGIGDSIECTFKLATPVFGRLAEGAGAHRQAIARLDRSARVLASLAHGQHELGNVLPSLGPSAALPSIDDPATVLEARDSSETLAENLPKITQRLRDWLDRQAEQTAKSSGRAAQENWTRLTAFDKEVAGRKPVISGCVGRAVVALQNRNSFPHRIEQDAAAVDAELDGPATRPLPNRFASRVTPLEAEHLAGIEESIGESIAVFRDRLGRTASGLTVVVDSLGFREARDASGGASQDACIDSALGPLAGTLDRIAFVVRLTFETEREMIIPAFVRSARNVRSPFPSYRSELRTIDSDLAQSAIKARIRSARKSAASAFEILGARDGKISPDASPISARRALEFSSLAGAPSALLEATETGLAAPRGLLAEELRGRVAAVAGPAGEPRQDLSRMQAEVNGIGVAFAVAPASRCQLLANPSHAARQPLDTNFLSCTEARPADLQCRDTTAAEQALSDLAVGPGRTSPLKLTSGEEPADSGSVELLYFQPSREAQPRETLCRKEF
jgi:hypothetical protein